MSRAFVKEQESVEELPERLISEHANLVTPDGLEHIEAEVARFDAAHAAAQAAATARSIAATARELRYWSTRLGTRGAGAPPADADHVHFGSTVTIEREDGRRQTFRIVGEDEADPARARSPSSRRWPRSLVGKSVGDTVGSPAAEAEIVADRLGASCLGRWGRCAARAPPLSRA